jgi:hypothetical protein
MLYDTSDSEAKDPRISINRGWRRHRGLMSAVLPQICAFKSKGKLAIVNPQRRGAAEPQEKRQNTKRKSLSL